MRIAIDGMGGDKGPITVVTGVMDAIRENPELTVLLVGDQKQLHHELAQHRFDPKRIEVHHASENILMTDHPAVAARQKKNSSIHLANLLVKNGEADAVFTAGNTGAAMAVSVLTLGRIPGILRPALLIDFPSLTAHGSTTILDVGANMDSKPKMLAQFAVMGDLYCRHLMNVEKPRVGLLSVGEEDSKGNELIREAHQFMRALKTINFVGNIEGQNVINGKVDVAVCDGFVGNVLLKFGEETIRLLGDIFKREMRSGNWLTKLSMGVLIPAMRRMYRRMDYKEYGSAPLLGVNGIATIGHGRSNSKAIKSAILRTARFIEQHINHKIEASLKENGVAE